jgi:hypothetical protein
MASPEVPAAQISFSHLAQRRAGQGIDDHQAFGCLLFSQA